MGIISGKQLEDYKKQFQADVERQADELMEKYKINLEPDVTDSQYQSALQAKILMELRQQAKERKDFIDKQREYERQENMNSQEKFLDASDKIYNKTPKNIEHDTFVSSETDRLCKALYSFGDK